MGFEEYESWVETLELLSKPETVRASGRDWLT
jgi:PHD/YefM family antitoxin component YafN of YafNO toxin-antitoxin module